MKCYSARKHLEKMATGEIDGILLNRLQEHLHTCAGCSGEYQEMKQALDLWRQASGIEPVPQFSLAWRQRIRQEAFKADASRRLFFSLLKASTLIPALGVLAVFVVFGVFSIYNRFTPKVAIEPLMKRYSPALSSTIGIPLIAKFRGGKTPRNITYHWTAEYGRFLSWDGKVTDLGTDAVTRGNKVYWSIDFSDQREGSSFDIHLQVKDLKTGKIITQAELGLEKDREGFFVGNGAL